MPNIKENLREEFYKSFTTSHSGDSGIGGNDPQDPVWDWDEDPKAVADFWLSKRDTELKTLLERVEEMKRDMTPHKELPTMGRKILDNADRVMKMNEDVGHNSALTDISKIIKTLIGE